MPSSAPSQLPPAPQSAPPVRAEDGAVLPIEPHGFFGHPRGLSTLFFTEMWERFSYYGMKALLILFMTAGVAQGGLGFDVAKASAIYSLYTAAVYLTALPGGWIADRFIGQRRAVLVGGIIIALGHFCMALPGVNTFFLGLVLIVTGTGLLKPNISAMVGGLYPPGDPRRDAGFSIFYMGINIGVSVAPVMLGLLARWGGWHAGFGVAGIGMVAGLAQYVLGGKHLAQVGLPVRREASQPANTGSRGVALAVGAALVVVLGGAQALGWVDMTSAVGLANAALVVIVALAIAFFGYMFTAGGLDAAEKRRLAAIGVFFIGSFIFWAGFEQAGSSLNLFADSLTDRDVLGWNMPTAWLQAVNGVFIITLAPVFAWLWVWLSRRGREPSSPLKFALGLILLGAGFVVMVAASSAAAGGHLVSPGWLIVTYLLHTFGELCLSPVGLSTVTKLSPPRTVGQMMGVWFLSMSLGNLIAGRVAGQFESLPLPQLFGQVAAVTVIAGVLLALSSRALRGIMGGVR